MKKLLLTLTIFIHLSYVFAQSEVNSNDKNNSKSPNIILILTDDHGWSQLSKAMDKTVKDSYSKYIETPNIDRLGDAGIRFTSGYSPAPVCTPTRRSILCGTTTARSGQEFKSPFVPHQHLTIPKALKMANPNYLTAHFGKWGGDMISTPEQSGYDASDGETGNGTGGMPSTLGIKSGKHGDGPAYFINNTDPKLSKSVSQSAIAFMKRSVEEKKPFFVQASFYAVHLSIVTSAAALEKYKNKGTPDRGYPPAFVAMLDELDQSIGKMLDALKEMGIDDNTYVFLMADNGSQEAPPGGNTKRLPMNYPLTGAKHSLYEGGIRVPFLVKGPGIMAGSYSKIPVCGYDLLPTFYQLAGGKKKLTSEIDGGSIYPLFNNLENGKVKRPNKGLYFDVPAYYNSVIRSGPFKLSLDWDKNGNVKDRRLYNLEKSLTENAENNIALANQKIADKLQRQLENYLKSVNASRLISTTSDNQNKID